MEDPGDLDLGHGRAAVLFPLAAVVGGDQEDGLVGDPRLLQPLKDQADQAVRLRDRLVILGRPVAVLMPGVIDVVEMDEGELGRFSLR